VQTVHGCVYVFVVVVVVVNDELEVDDEGKRELR
jgi:hypothetical protein